MADPNVNIGGAGPGGGGAARNAQMGAVRQQIQGGQQWPQVLAAMQSNAWTPTPYAQQTPYVQAAGMQGRQGAEASMYGAQLGFLNQLQQNPWDLAQTAQAVVPQSQASMYQAYAPAAAQIQGAHFPAAASMYQTGVGAQSARDLMQLGNEAKSANLYAMLQALQPMMQPPQQAPGFTTNYGAGVG